MTPMDMSDDKEEMVVMPKWRAIELGAKPAQEDTGRTVTQVEAQVSQHQQYAPPPELHTAPVSLPRKQHEPGPDYHEGKGLIRYSRIKVLEPGGKGGARVEKLEPHVEMLSEHIRGSLAVPGEKQGPNFEVKVLVDSGSGVTAIIKALARRLEIQLPDLRLGAHLGVQRV